MKLKPFVTGIIVSNHGARQLDGVPASVEVLSKIVENARLAGISDVYYDGGIRRFVSDLWHQVLAWLIFMFFSGTDVFKALALGAKAVFIGRPVLWGLAFNVRPQAIHWFT